jgi:hypothetical protein
MAQTSSNVARFTRKINDAQKEAILAAHFRDGIRGAEIMRMAERGQLAGGPFGLGRYVYEILETGREQWEAKDDQALADGTRKALREAHQANLKALRATKAADPAERARMAKATAESFKAMQAVNGKPATRPKPTALNGQSAGSEETAKAPGDGTLGELLELAG